MKKFLVVILTLYLSFIIFMPKNNLWFTAEEFLKERGVIVSGERVKDFGVLFSMKKGEIYYDGLKSFYIGDMKVLPYLFFNQISFKNLKSSNDVKPTMDISFKELKIRNSILKPFLFFVKGNGNIGKFEGDLDIKRKVFKMLLTPSKEFLSSKMRRYFKKSKEGYIYEYHF